MKIATNIFSKIIIAVISLAIIAGGAYAAYRIIKKAPLNKLANLITPGPLRGPTSSQRAANLSDDEIIKWTNYYRGQENIKDLAKNTQLTRAAQAKADDMFAKQYFEHLSPTGQSAADLVIAEGYNYKVVGENLALGDFTNEKDLVDAWMASPGHRANILKKDYQDIGVVSKMAVYQGRLTWISVQEFGAKAPNCTTPDQNLSNEISSKQARYDSLTRQIQSLSDDGNALVGQGNAKIKQGNRIYAQTGSRSQAQPYWDAGKSLQTQGQAKIDQADALTSTHNNLKVELQNLIDDYNAQVNEYNGCIS